MTDPATATATGPAIDAAAGPDPATAAGPDPATDAAARPDPATAAAPPWWKSAVVYQLYPRSFSTTGITPGVGDLPGITAHLDHLTWLGVDAIWLSPFFRSPMADYGYDVSDYCDVDPIFGTLADFDALVEQAHARGIKVLIDWVPNHTSDQHPWFVESRSSRDNPKRDWYFWRDPGPNGEPPNNWIGAFLNGPAWTFDERTQQSYLHNFLPQQPDLNWANPEVEAAMLDTLRFWLDRGVDGFRMDVIHLIGKDPTDLADWPEGSSPYTNLPDPPHAHRIMRAIRTVLDDYAGDRTSVGEVYILDTARVAAYYGADDELHMSFNFPPVHAKWKASTWRRLIDDTLASIVPAGQPTWVLSNHDNPRHRTRFGSEARARAAAVLLLTLPGTPFLYAGEELGLEDAVVPPERVLDPGGRDGCRAPIPWTGEPGHGWGDAEPWLPFPPDPDTRNAATERDDPRSMANLYRQLLAARRASPALHASLDFAWVEGAPDGVLAYDRGDHRVVVNMTDRDFRVGPTLAGYELVVSSSPEPLAADSGALFRRSG